MTQADADRGDQPQPAPNRKNFHQMSYLIYKEFSQGFSPYATAPFCLPPSIQIAQLRTPRPRRMSFLIKNDSLRFANPGHCGFCLSPNTLIARLR